MKLHCNRCDAEVEPVIVPSGQHMRADCPDCGRYIKFVDKNTAGVEPRSLSSRPGLTPSRRARILAQCGHACLDCGRRPPEVVLQVDHLIPREVAARHGMLDELIDDDLNLVAKCEECNSGRRMDGFSGAAVRLIYRAMLLAKQEAP